VSREQVTGAPLEVRSRRSLLTAGAHLAALSAFAFAQPLFSLLSESPAFFAARGSTVADVVFFALGITLAPAALLMALECLARLVDLRLQAWLHLGFVAGLAALIVLQVSVRLSVDFGFVLIAAAALAGVGVAASYARLPPVRSFLTVLAPAPLVFLALFLQQLPVTRFASPEDRVAGGAPVESRTPVVVIVLDELPTVSLLDHTGELDVVRYPGFGELATDSTWYRNATTINARTHLAVPAILTGRIPDQDSVPVFGEHPNNLFTLLEKSYELRALESVTSLCPPGVCRGAPTESFAGRLESLWTDLGVVYAHLVLPESLSDGLPPITDNWSNFLGGEDDDAEGASLAKRTEGRRALRGSVHVCGRKVCDFASLVSESPRPTLYYLHSLLPHAPWLYLPSGRRYAGGGGEILGVSDRVWGDDEFLAEQGHQRHLLQLGYTDRALAGLLDRLRRQGLYDRAAIVLVADHGVSFRAGQPRRNATRQNLADIAFVPLLVKEPGQSEGRVDDSHATTVDVLPTIADLLGVDVPWSVDGHSLLGGGGEDGRVSIPDERGEPVVADLSSLLEERDLALLDQHALFRDGNWQEVYGAWAEPGLLGTPVGSLNVVEGQGTFDLDGARQLRAPSPRDAVSRSYLTGSIDGRVPAGTRLLVVVNGTLVSAARAYEDGGEVVFGSLIPEESLRPGANEVEILVVSETPSGSRFVRLRAARR
jgi:Sulfatase